MVPQVLGAPWMLTSRRVEEPQWVPMSMELGSTSELVVLLVGPTKAKAKRRPASYLLVYALAD